MVMQDMTRPGETFVLGAGSTTSPASAVDPGRAGAPAPAPERGRADRLGFARWLVDPANPLTARVAVNRLWQMYFGTGLVRTVEDFGTQGEVPSHPELLDWLATEFVRTGWDVKALQRLDGHLRDLPAVLARHARDRLERDPENRLLSRGPRFRLPAEMIRDSACRRRAACREARRAVGQALPAGRSLEGAGRHRRYQPDHGRDLYRRSLYTFWKRTIPPPAMVTFDAAGREACAVREARTDTPLQALNFSTT